MRPPHSEKSRPKHFRTAFSWTVTGNQPGKQRKVSEPRHKPEAKRVGAENLLREQERCPKPRDYPAAVKGYGSIKGAFGGEDGVSEVEGQIHVFPILQIVLRQRQAHRPDRRVVDERGLGDVVPALVGNPQGIEVPLVAEQGVETRPEEEVGHQVEGRHDASRHEAVGPVIGHEDHPCVLNRGVLGHRHQRGGPGAERRVVRVDRIDIEPERKPVALRHVEELVPEEERALRQMRRNDAKHIKGEIIDDPYMHEFDLETFRAKFDEDRNRSNQRVAEKACLYRDMTLEELNEEQKRLHEDRKERRRNFREMNEDWADDEEY